MEYYKVHLSGVVGGYNFIFTYNSLWRHPMEPFSALLAICAGNSPVTGEFPAQRPVTRSFDASFDLRLNKRLIQQAGDLRRYSAHNDVTVIREEVVPDNSLQIIFTRIH